MEIKRDHYLQELIDRKHNGLIKVITGIRRVGKSYLLFTIFHNHLIQEGVKEDHIIEIPLDNPKYDEYTSPKTLLSYVESKITDKDMYYILLDEVQMMDNFEGALNGLLYLKNVDIYVTGSNSKFLSTDVITEFRGRGDEIHVYPLSFSEFMSVYDGNKFDGWTEYATYGGLPLTFFKKTDAQKSEHLISQLKETYLIDVIGRNRIKNTAELETLLDILASSVGSLTNPQRIVNTFESVDRISISNQTVHSYLTAFEEAFLIKGVKRYNVRGRKYIGSPMKYYFEDVGLRNARLNFRQYEENYLMENVIYNELRMRGFNVDVGVVEVQEKDASGKYVRKHLEIDFVANRGSERYYIQSAFEMRSREKTVCEKKSLVNAGDSFKKIVVVKDVVKLHRDDDGIVVMSIYDFLLNENSLYL